MDPPPLGEPRLQFVHIVRTWLRVLWEKSYDGIARAAPAMLDPDDCLSHFRFLSRPGAAS
jgi:hypothetical protein